MVNVIFFIFVLICSLLTPAVMLYFGYRWQTKPPHKINMGYGYRTRRSMHSQETWNFAHSFCGKLWIRMGWVTLALTVTAMAVLACLTLEIETVGTVVCIVVFLQLIPLFSSLFVTEHALKHKFRI